MQLTTHFTLEEFLVSQTAARLGIDNSPTPEVLENLKKLSAFMEEVRLFVDRPIRISSGYRSPALNAAVPGSSKTSAHCKGLACDCTIAGIGNIEACRLIAERFSGYDQIIYEFGPTGWVHVGLTNGTPRMQTLTAVRGRDGKTEYLPGFVESA